MSQTKVVNCKVKYIRPQYNNLKEWMNDPQNVYVGRAGVVFIDGQRFPKNASPFANPFKISASLTRDQAVEQYKTHIKHKVINPQEIKELLLSYKGKNLGCWCHPEPCHANILVEIMEELSA